MPLRRQVYLLLLLSFFTLVGNAQPVANFNAPVTSGCAPLLVQFNNTSSGATSYHWDFGNIATSTLTNPSTTYTTPGTYTVTLIAYNGPNSNTKVLTNYITVYAQPTVSFTAGPTTVCPGAPVSFTSTSNPNTPGNASYYWDFGDGNNSTAQNPTHAYTLSGNFNISLTVTNSQGCQATLVQANYIHVHPKPTAAFTCPTTAFCNPPATITFNNTSTGTNPLGYAWNFGDAGTSTAATPPPHTYNTAGAYTIKLTVTDANGCKDSLVRPNYINIQSSPASFTAPVSACAGELITFTNTSPPPISISNWNFGDNGTGAGTLVTHVYANAGTYQIRLVTQSGCLDTIYKNIIINPKPIISFNYSPVNPCQAPDTIQFNNQTTNGFTYKWYFGDGDTSSLSNPSHIYHSAGPFDVKLVATSPWGCKDSLLKPAYVYLNPFTVFPMADAPGGCVPATFHFSYTISFNQPGVSQIWNFGDNTTSTLATPSHTYNAVGTYTVTLTVTTANGCIKSGIYNVHVGVHSFPDFTASPLSGCVHDSIFFQNLSTNATNYKWYFGDTYTSTDTNAAHAYVKDSTSFGVMLISYNNGCPDTLIKPNLITIHPSTALYTGMYSCDTSKKLILTNYSSPYTSYLWDFEDNTSSTTDVSPQHVYSSLGTYTVKLVTYNSTYGCKDSLSETFTMINPAPGFVANDTVICKNTSVHFSAFVDNQGGPSSSISDYTWVTDAQTVNTGLNAFYNRTYNNGGYFDVKLSIRDEHNCIHSITKHNYILVAQPTATLMASPPSGCAPLNTLFTDISTNYPGIYDSVRHWDFGNDSTTINTATVAHTYSDPGAYDVRLVVTNNIGCRDSVLMPSYIHVTNPIASFHADTAYPCLHDSIHFVNTSTGFTTLSYSWNFGDNSTSTLKDPVHLYTDTGSYTVTLIAGDITGCSDTSIKTQYIKVTRPYASFTPLDTTGICTPMQARFTSTSFGATDYRWDFGNANTSNLANPTNLYNMPGHYNVQCVAINQHGCTDTAYGQLTLLGYDGALSFDPSTGCSPLTVNFTAGVTNVNSYTWDFGDGNTVTGGITTSHVYTRPGTYVPLVIFNDSIGCHSASISYDTIKVDGLVTNYLFEPNPACVLQTVNFRDTFPDIATYAWEFDNGETSTSASPAHYYDNAGEHTVKLVVLSNTGCSDTVTNTVTIHPLPDIYAGADTIICGGGELTIHAEGGVSYVWTPPVGLSCFICPETVVKPKEPTDYIVLGTDEFGCRNTDTIHVDQKQCNCIVSLPTAFTPNGDGKNDRFGPIVSDMTSVHMEIYNRWGQAIFYTTYPGHSWDGTYKGVACDAGTYYYFVKVKCVLGQQVMKKGDLILVR